MADDAGHVAASEVVLAHAIVAAARAVPGVADLSTGGLPEVATYGAHERVRGLAVTPTADGPNIEIHLCARYDVSLVLTDLAARLRMAIRECVEALGARTPARIDVVFDDVRTEEDAGA
jgi:uncharacterized alkaline shock family protein YloU